MAGLALGLTIFGKGYLAFTAVGQGGHDVRVAYEVGGQWSVIGVPLDANVADDAIGPPQAAVAPARDPAGATHVLGEDPRRGDAADQVGGEVTVEDAQAVGGSHGERGAG